MNDSKFMEWSAGAGPLHRQWRHPLLKLHGRPGRSQQAALTMGSSSAYSEVGLAGAACSPPVGRLVILSSPSRYSRTTLFSSARTTRRAVRRAGRGAWALATRAGCATKEENATVCMLAQGKADRVCVKTGLLKGCE